MKNLYLSILILLSLPIFSQRLKPLDPNFEAFSTGIYNAPCSDCQEDVSKRGIDYRYFSSGTKFWTQKSLGSMFFTDKNGETILIDPRLKKTSEDFYEAINQPYPVFIDINNQKIGLRFNENDFSFSNFELYHELENGEIINFGSADFSVYTAGDDGIYIYNAWPKIDLTVTVGKSQFETKLIINEKLDIQDGGYLILKQDLTDGYKIHYGDDFIPGELYSGDIVFANDENNSAFTINKALAYDNSVIRENISEVFYRLTNSKLEMYTPVKWINSNERIYPIIIDPLVSTSSTYTAGNMEFRFNGSFCAGPKADCDYSLDVPIPSNSTLTACYLTASYQTVTGGCPFSCWMSDAGFFVEGPCDYSPGAGSWWSCLAPGGNSTGTCSGSGIDMTSTISCISPVCDETLTFFIYNSYCYCNSAGTDCSGTLPCQRMLSGSWIITIEGNTLETLGDATDGSGYIVVNADCGDTATLDPLVLYGVPPYSYLWTDGGTGADTSVVSLGDGLWTYTCEITDACGITRTATFDFVVDDCGPLGIEIIDFYGEIISHDVLLSWETMTEMNNNYFTLQKSNDGQNWQILGQINGNGTSGEINYYSFTDEFPFAGNNYYRLSQTDFDGSTSLAGIVVVNFSSETTFEIFPNPTNDFVELYSTNFMDKEVKIYDSQGKILKNFLLEESLTKIDISQFPFGNYLLVIADEENEPVTLQLIKK